MRSDRRPVAAPLLGRAHGAARRWSSLGELDVERGPAGPILHPGTASVLGDEPGHQGQSDARAGGVAVGNVPLTEGLEDGLLEVVGHAWPLRPWEGIGFSTGF